MKGQCCICTDVFELDSDISAAQCGHTFHAKCLQQWLEHSRTCPHCRDKINVKTVVPKLFFDAADDGPEVDVDVSSLRNQLSDLKAQLRQKDKERNDLQAKFVGHTQKMDELNENFRSMEIMYKMEKSNISALKKELRFHKELQNDAQLAREEAKMLKTKLEDLKNVEKIVKGHEDEIENIISRGDTKQLSTWCCILQKELNMKRQECRTLRDTAERLKKESSVHKRASIEKGDALHAAKEQIRILQEQLKDTDTEVMKLKKKNDALLKAIGSPSDTARSFAHRLIHESPAPMMTPPTKKPRLSDHNESLIGVDSFNTSADLFIDSPDTPDGVSHPSPATVKGKNICQEYGTKFVKITSAAKKNAASAPPKQDITDISNIPGLSNFNLFKKKTGMGLADSSSAIRKGYNGFGGHEKFINVKANGGFKAPAPVRKQNKINFGPSRTISKTCPPLPSLNFLSQD